MFEGAGGWRRKKGCATTNEKLQLATCAHTTVVSHRCSSHQRNDYKESQPQSSSIGLGAGNCDFLGRLRPCSQEKSFIVDFRFAECLGGRQIWTSELLGQSVILTLVNLENSPSLPCEYQGGLASDLPLNSKSLRAQLATKHLRFLHISLHSSHDHHAKITANATLGCCLQSHNGKFQATHSSPRY